MATVAWQLLSSPAAVVKPQSAPQSSTVFPVAVHVPSTLHVPRPVPMLGSAALAFLGTVLHRSRVQRRNRVLVGSGCSTMRSRRHAHVRLKASVEDLLVGVPRDLKQVLQTELGSESSTRQVIVVASKEGPGPIEGYFVGFGDSPSLEHSTVQLRSLAPDSADIIVEVLPTEMTMSAGLEQWHGHFYPYGGHEFSLSRSFIINLASVAKVLRPGGKFIFRTLAESAVDILPYRFLALRHLLWDVRVVRGESSDDHPSTDGPSVVICTLRPGANEALTAHTPMVVAEECSSEESRRRYFDVIHPLVRAARHGDSLKQISVLDVGGGDGSLAAWFFDREAVRGDGPYRVTLMEENAELAARAAQRLPVQNQVTNPSGSSACVLSIGECPWPFANNEFDVVVLAFVLHHVRPGHAEEVLREARRVARDRVLVLEDLPSAEQQTPSARRLAWLVTEEHFRPFGQDPVVFSKCVLSDQEWREMFARCGMELQEAVPIRGSLRHPVPHMAYHLSPDGSQS